MKASTTASGVARRVETILVVDDTSQLLNLVVAILEPAGFHVLRADSGANAVKLSDRYDGSIELLLSDVEMPGMSGPDLGLALKLTRPDLRVMLMSGMENGSLLVLNYGWAFIEKPFLSSTLLEMIYVVLDTPDKSQGSHGYDTRVQTEIPK